MNERYSRQELFPEIGKEGQKKLFNSRIAVFGAGALGAAHAESLARAGVGFIRIIDRDFVEFSNLQRQVLYTELDASQKRPKAVAAMDRLREINSEIEIEGIVADINHANVEDFLKDCDLVIDGTDNFQVRYLLNDAAVKHRKPWIYGAAVSSYGTTMTIIPMETPCLRCVFEEIPSAGSSPTCDTAGVIAPIIASISAVQVTEAIKILTGRRDALHGSLMQIDVWHSDWRRISLTNPRNECPACGHRDFEFLTSPNEEYSTILCGRNAVQIQPSNSSGFELEKLADRYADFKGFSSNEYLIRFEADGHDFTVFRDARAIIGACEDVLEARVLYSKFVGV